MILDVNVLLTILNGFKFFYFSDKKFFMRNGKCYLEDQFIEVYKEKKCEIGKYYENIQIR